MKRHFAVIMAALLIAAMAGCSQSGTSSTADSDTVQSSADSSVAESAESEISEAESSVVSEVTSTESSEEKSDTSAAESSENKSKTESSKPKNEESSKKETSKAETSKAETSKPVESSNPAESSKPEESSTPSKKTEESSTPSSTPKQEVKATGITLDLSSLSLTSGSTQELNAYILWSNGTSSYNGITWSTSNNGVATVSSSGYVTAKSAGTATITASYGSYSKSCTVTVKAAQSSQPSGGGNGGTQTRPSQPSGGGNSGNGGSGNGGSSGGKSDSSGVTIKFTDNTTVEVGKESSLAIAVYENGSRYNSSNYNISYKSSNTSVVTVGSDGFVKGISQGTCTITATYGSSTTTCTVTVKAASGSSSGGGSSSTKDEYYYDEFGNRYSTTWVESEHEAFKTQTRKGYTIWECPEMVPIINEYRAKEGKSPLYWYSSDKAKQEDIEFMKKRGDTQFFKSDGSVDWGAYYKYWGVGQGCRDNCEYHMDGNPDPHGSNYSSNVAECVFMTNGKYDVRGAVETWMNSPAHRAYIMKLEGSVYICHNGKFFYLS